MWFKQKTELDKLIINYGRDKEVLQEFARSVHKARIEDITIENVKNYYKAILEPQNSLYTRNSCMLAVRKFFRENRSMNCLRASEILDDPLKSVARNDIVQYMPIEKKKGKGRPAQVELIKKVISLREKEGLSFRAIARALNRDLGQVHVWYKRRDILLRSELSTDKLLA